MERSSFPRWCTVLLLVCGAAFMAFGVWRGEMGLVVKKAVNICLECIGIG